MSVVLHQWEISPFCQKVARALRHKGMAFEAMNYNGVLATRAQGLSKVGKLPVLDIDGQRIQDSTRIARYLDDAYPQLPRLYPQDPALKAQVELWEDWADELLYFYEVYFRAKDPVAMDAAADIAVQGRPGYERLLLKPVLKSALLATLYFQGLGRMEPEDVEAVLPATGWLVGSDRTIADIAVGSQLAEVVRTSQSMRPLILSRPAMARWLQALDA